MAQGEVETDAAPINENKTSKTEIGSPLCVLSPIQRMQPQTVRYRLFRRSFRARKFGMKLLSEEITPLFLGKLIELLNASPEGGLQVPRP